MSFREMKRGLKGHLSVGDFDAILRLVHLDIRYLASLISFSYDKSSIESYRAAVYAGRIIGIITREDYEQGRLQVRKVLWNTSDESGTIAWTAPEILGEAVRENPKPLLDIIPLIVGMGDEDNPDNIFTDGALYAIGRIAELHPEYIDDSARDFIAKYLTDERSQVCANAIVAARLAGMDIEKDIPSGRTDSAMIYVDDKLRSISITDLIKTSP